MTSSETTFGSRFQNAQTILTYIEELPDYAPPQAADTVVNFKNFLLNITETNQLNSELEQHYRAAVKARQDAFRDGDASLMKLLPSLRGAVDAAYGKNSQKAKAIASLIKKLRSPKLSKSSSGDPPLDPAQAPAVPGVDEGISQSQLSFGSMTKTFNDIITTLTQLGGYNPSNPDLQIAALQAFSLSLNTLNLSVAEEYGKLSTERENRLNLYAELSERVQRIKAYLKAQYGSGSKIYELVKGVKV